MLLDGRCKYALRSLIILDSTDRFLKDAYRPKKVFISISTWFGNPTSSGLNRPHEKSWGGFMVQECLRRCKRCYKIYDMKGWEKIFNIFVSKILCFIDYLEYFHGLY